MSDAAQADGAAAAAVPTEAGVHSHTHAHSTPQAPASASAAPTSVASDAPTITDDEIATTLRVLKAAGASQELWSSKRLQSVRRAIQPMVQWQMAKMYGGKTREEYRAESQAALEATVRRHKQRQHDRSMIDKARLRAARLEKLAELSTHMPAHVHMHLIPDGVADAGVEQGSVGDGMQRKVAALADASTGSVVATRAPVTGGDGGVASTEEDMCTGARADDHGSDGAGAAGAAASSSADSITESAKLEELFRSCYTCKRRFQELHHFYDQLCPPCAALNWGKRNATVDLRGRIALVTGARVKIGFHCALKLLRAGALVIATSRFPNDAAARFAEQPDFAAWRANLHIFGLDMRNLAVLEAFCAMLNRDYDHLDIIINNACQTVRRPPAYYLPFMERERTAVSSLPDAERSLVQHNHTFQSELARSHLLADTAVPLSAADGPAPAEADHARASAASTAPTTTPASSAATSSAEASQLALITGDDLVDTTLFPTGALDVNAQQIDLRTHNTWVMRMHEVSTPELAEVFAINAIAPFVLNARLKPLMTRGRVIPEGVTVRVTHVWIDTSGYCTELLPHLVQPPLHRSRGVDPGASFSPGAWELFAQEANGPTGSGKRSRRAVTETGNKLLGEISPPVPAGICRFIVNVSAMEGKFNRFKMPTHPHTNMAKAALNMMTRTSAQDFAQSFIFMTAVDTGWINEENPLERAARTAARNKFQTPLDEVDAAARVLDPVFGPLSAASDRPDGTCCPLYGAFLKDYSISEW